MLSEEQFRYKWTEIRSGIRNVWGLLAEEELDDTKGNLNAIAELVESKYRESKKDIKEKLDTLMNSFDNDTDKGNIGLVSSYQRIPESDSTTPDQHSNP